MSGSIDENALFKVETNATVGRYAITKHDLNAGDLIFTEKPFAYGPKSESPPVCLGCHRLVDCTVLCTKCKWPVCNQQCEQLPIHQNNECQLFTNHRIKFQRADTSNNNQCCLQYECITPLRVLLAKDHDPIRWRNEIEPMEAHNAIRQHQPIWRFNQINIVNYLRDYCRLSDSDLFTSDRIHTVCGLLEVNAFESPTKSSSTDDINNNNQMMIRCLYPNLAILSHSCVANITHSIDTADDFVVHVRAAIDVPANGQLFSRYTYSLAPTLMRRDFLSKSKYFDCTCRRCSDPTELDTNMSTLKCGQCNNGLVMLINPVNTDNDNDWTCTCCPFRITSNVVRELFTTIQNEIDSLLKNHHHLKITDDDNIIEQYERIYRKYQTVLHSNHAYLMMIRYDLSQLYGHIAGYKLNDLPNELLERKIQICQELMRVLDVIEPGHSRLRGYTLYELYAPLVLLANRQKSNSEVLLKEKFQEAIDILTESATILRNQSCIGIAANKGLADLKDKFNNMF